MAEGWLELILKMLAIVIAAFSRLLCLAFVEFALSL
jgi:hypothetical protein